MVKFTNVVIVRSRSTLNTLVVITSGNTEHMMDLFVMFCCKKYLDLLVIGGEEHLRTHTLSSKSFLCYLLN